MEQSIQTESPANEAPLRRGWEEKLTEVLNLLKAMDWTIGEFLYHLFRLRDKHGQLLHRSQRHGTIVGMFLSGATRHSAAEIISFWLKDEAGRPSKETPDYAARYSPSVDWTTIRHAQPAITAMAVQLCEQQLIREQRVAVRGENGLHGSMISPNGHRQLCWKDIGKDTVSSVKKILMRHQPLAFHLLLRLATPRPRKDNHGNIVVRKSRPTDGVS